MQKREKYLLIGLTIAAVAWFLMKDVASLDQLLPFQSKRDERTLQQEQLAKNEKQESDLFAARVKLKGWAGESLPRNPLTAQGDYQVWLVDLARLSGLTGIDPRNDTRRAEGTTYVSIPVTLKAKGTLNQLATFLYHFERTRLLHRVTQIDVVSEETEGDPLMAVLLRCEGIAMTDAPERTRLFPHTQLTAAVDEAGTKLRVGSSLDFPSQGEFRIRIGREFLTVTARSANDWTVTRGVDTTTPLAHAAGDDVELAPFRLPRDASAPKTIAEYRDLLEHGPFTKPRPPITYNPRLAEISNQTIIRGAPLRIQARVSSWDPAEGKPKYSLGFEAPASMTVDADGWITWSPSADTPADTYPASVEVTSEKNEDLFLAAQFLVTLQEQNLPPRITAPAKIPTVYLGREWTLPIAAEDPEQAGALRFSLSGQPEGLTIDSSGRLQWTPPLTVEPKDYPVQVRVEDAGTPPQSASSTLTLHVEDDSAQYTYLVGCWAKGDDWTAWLLDRATGTNYYLKVGSEFRISDVSGKVTAIDLPSMTFENAEGTWRLLSERSLRMVEKVPATAAPANSATSAEPPDAATVEQPAPAPRS